VASAAAAPSPSPEPTRELHAPYASRARTPDASGFIERDGVRVAWERYGVGSPTILLMPTWSIVHSRYWKFQIPYLARHFRVVTFDGRGNGRSDRPAEPAAYADTEFVGDAIAVLETSGTDAAVFAGFSMGAGYSLRMAVDHPERVLGLAFFGATIPIWDADPSATPGYDPSFEEPQPEDGLWGRYNAHYWRRDWNGFAEWFAAQKIFPEPHSTKAIEDTVRWMNETDPETIIATERAPYLVPPDAWGPRPPTEGKAVPFVARVHCPVLLVHGSADPIIPIDVARRVSAMLGAPLVTVVGGGHSPIAREPVLANLLIRDFVRGLPGGS
jgi:pimeloyl-ACP methyl ester carboxylesterase